MNFSNNEKIITSTFNNNSNDNTFLLTKMLKANKKNKNKFNKSNRNHPKLKLSYNSNNNYDKISVYNNKKNGFENELLIRAVENNNIEKIELKNISKGKNILLGNKEKEMLNNNNYIYFTNNNIDTRKNSPNKRRINSAHAVNLDYNNNRLKEIENIINSKNYNNYNDEVQKILAFKENIFVHSKNITLLDSNRVNADEIDLNNKIYNTDYNKYLGNFIKNKNNQKPKRPKSAKYGHSTYSNLEIKNLNLNEITWNKMKVTKKDRNYTPSKANKIFDDQYYDLSYINNSNRKENISEKLKNNKFKTKNKTKIPASEFDNFSFSPSEKNFSKCNEHCLYQHNYSNNENISKLLTDSEIKFPYKENIGHIFRRRPMSIINEKYLIYLPRNIKKDINNKYNFFSYLLIENIYKKDQSNLHNFKIKKENKNKSFSTKQKKNNKIKNNNNYTEYNYNKNIKKNESYNYKLNCRKEEEFINYLKKLDYIKKHPKKFLNQKLNLNDINVNNQEKIQSSIDKKNHIYKSVKFKIENSNSYDYKQRNNNNKLYDKKIASSEEESELCEIIKSQPFKYKNKKKSIKI